MRLPTSTRGMFGQLLLWLGLGLLIGLLIVMAPRALQASVWSVEDYVAHWSTARLNLTGGNPYDPVQILALEQLVGWPNDYPLPMWNPPWTLTYLLPFGCLDFIPSRFLWLLFQLALLLGSMDVLWRYYDGPPERHWLAWIIGFTFFPTLLLLRMGQISFLVLVGIVGFMTLEKRGKDGWAGASLALAAVKPHLVYLVFLAVLVWAVRQRRWSVLLGGIAMGLLSVLIPWVCNPAVFDQYLYALEHNPPSYMIAATVGSIVRFTIGKDYFALQFVPSLLGVLWLCIHGYLHRSHWEWREQMPLLLFASLLTSSYGWSYDLVLLLVPVIQASLWVLKSPNRLPLVTAIAIYGLVNGVAALMNALWRIEEHFYVWMAPALLLGYLLVRRQVREDSMPFPAPVV